MHVLVNYILPIALAAFLGWVIYLVGSLLNLNSYAQMSYLSSVVIYMLWIALTEIGKRWPPQNPTA